MKKLKNVNSEKYTETNEVSTVVSSASITIDADNVTTYTVTALAEATTFNAPTGTPQDGQKLTIRINDDGTARGITWNAAFAAGSLTLPTTTEASVTMYLGFLYNSATSKWDYVAINKDGTGGSISDTGRINFPYQNGWVDFDTTTYGGLKYRKIGNVVYLRGLAKNGSSTTLGYLPAGYRPGLREIISVTSNQVFGAIDIDTDGLVYARVYSNAWISFGGISFIADN